MIVCGLPINEGFLRALESSGQLPSGPLRERDVVAALLQSDFHVWPIGTLPSHIKTLSQQLLTGRHLLQIDEVVNIAAPLKFRFDKSAKDRMLKFHMTDGDAVGHVMIGMECVGIQQVVAMEYRPIQELNIDSPAGIKVLVTDAFVHRGVFMLCPENVHILGGSVERLIQAQAKSKAILTTEPRPGKAKRNVARLYEDAQLTAWDINDTPQPVPQQQPQPVPLPLPQPVPLPQPQPVHYHQRIQPGDAVSINVCSSQLRSPTINNENNQPLENVTSKAIHQQPTNKAPLTRPAVTHLGITGNGSIRQQAAEDEVIIVESPPVLPSQSPKRVAFDVIDLLDDE